jgi:uncharacterized membrane protein
MGLGMIIIPNLLLGFFGYPETKEIWIRMLGLLAFTTGIYYFHSSAHNQTAFYKATIIGRLFFFLMTIVFVFAFQQSPMLVLIGCFDLFGAFWTYLTFRNSKV